MLNKIAETTGQNTARKNTAPVKIQFNIRASLSLRLQKSSRPRRAFRLETVSHLQKNSHKSRFWILWILLILLRSIVFPKRLATSLYSCVWFCKGISWKKKCDNFIGALFWVLHSTVGQLCSYLIGHFSIHVLPVWWHGDSLIFTDITLNSRRHNKTLEADYNYCQSFKLIFKATFSCLGHCDKYNEVWP